LAAPSLDFKALTLEELSSFRYFTPGVDDEREAVPRRLPARIRALDGVLASVEGFMVPAEFDGETLQSFMLVKTRMVCCFGRVPRLNEWVMVTVPPGLQVFYTPDVPVRVQGRLAVGETQENGLSMGLYRLAAQHVDQPKKPWGKRLNWWLAERLRRAALWWRSR
jgi:hypothetical protein